MSLLWALNELFWYLVTSWGFWIFFCIFAPFAIYSDTIRSREHRKWQEQEEAHHKAQELFRAQEREAKAMLAENQTQ